MESQSSRRDGHRERLDCQRRTRCTLLYTICWLKLAFVCPTLHWLPKRYHPMRGLMSRPNCGGNSWWFGFPASIMASFPNAMTACVCSNWGKLNRCFAASSVWFALSHSIRNNPTRTSLMRLNLIANLLVRLMYEATHKRSSSSHRFVKHSNLGRCQGRRLGYQWQQGFQTGPR